MMKLYAGKIRDGKPGFLTEETYEEHYDVDKKYAYLSPFPKVEYSSDWYRKTVDKSELPKDFFLEHDYQQAGYFSVISQHLQRGMTVADCGCGAGSMLDLISGLAEKTVAIEPFLGYHDSLQQRGHEVFSSIESAQEILGKSAGFANARRFYYQEFSIGNTFNWLKDGRATGNGSFDYISPAMDKNWISFLEASGQSYNVGVVLEK